MSSLSSSRQIFVVGCPRSGTSWVSNLISSHGDVLAVPMESHNYHFVYEPFFELKTWDFQDRMQHWEGVLQCCGLKSLLLGLNPVDAWESILRDYQILSHYTHGLRGLVSYEELKSLIAAVRTQPLSEPARAEQLIVKMFDLFFSKNGDSSKILLEKTPLNLYYSDRLLRLFPNSRIVEVIRDGRDVCVSYNALAKRQRWARVGTEGAIRQWRTCINYGEKNRAQPELSDRIYPVRFESLKRDTEGELQKLFDFAQLDYTPEKISEIVANYDINKIAMKGEGLYLRKGAVGDWKERLSDREIMLCEQLAGEQLSWLGYR